MVDCDGLENRCTREGTVSSNLTLSASQNKEPPRGALFFDPAARMEPRSHAEFGEGAPFCRRAPARPNGRGAANLTLAAEISRQPAGRTEAPNFKYVGESQIPVEIIERR